MNRFEYKIFEAAKEDKELLDIYNLTEDSEPYKIVATYISFYFPPYVSKEICKHFYEHFYER